MLLLWAFALAWPQSVRTDPCEGPLPHRPGQVFSGVVRHVGDGDSLCLSEAGGRVGWIEVRLADFDAPELSAPGGQQARRRLRGLALGRRLDCVAVLGRAGRVVVYDRVIAACRLDGRPIGERLRAAGGREGGR
ncbi:MAG: nuclease [Caulobacteraceae bacterium]|nr:nuclease [Caulobacteraceae bacterium]